VSAPLPFRSADHHHKHFGNAEAVYEEAYGLEDLQPHASAWKREQRARERRLSLNSRLGEVEFALAKAKSLLSKAPFREGKENRLPLELYRKSSPENPLSLSVRKAQARGKIKELEEERRDILLRLEHEFRKELECPAATRDLSRAAYHVYLQLAQYEGLAARGRAFTFVLEGRKLTNRNHYLRKLRGQGLTVTGVIGCALLENGRHHAHFHGVVILPEGFSGSEPRCRKAGESPIQTAISELLDGVRVLPLTPRTETRTQAAALAKGFLAFCLYLAENYDQPIPTELKPLLRIRHFPDRKSGLSLTEAQKRNLHPYRTRGELELFRQIFPRGRGGLEARKAFWRARPIPVYRYAAEAVLRDGFLYHLTPDWGYQLNYGGMISVPCEYARQNVTTPYAGECELDIILVALRFRRMIPRDVSPACGPMSYTTLEGRVRPAA